jgi:hypothetical protein
VTISNLALEPTVEVRTFCGRRESIFSDLHREDDATIAFSMSGEDDRVVTVAILNSALKSALNDLEKRLETRISDESVGLGKRINDEGAATRTHFNVMVERVESAVKLVTEVNSHHSTILDDHEARLQKIEGR